MIKKEDIKVGMKFCVREKCLNNKFSTRANGDLIVYTITGIYTQCGETIVKAQYKERVGSKPIALDVNLPIYSFIDLKYSDRNEYVLASIVEEDEKQEQVFHPSHYAWLKDLCGVEPLDICRHLDFNVGNAIKYLLRKDKVDGDKTKTEKRIEDLRKAVFYIEDEIKLLKDGKE